MEECFADLLKNLPLPTYDSLSLSQCVDTVPGRLSSASRSLLIIFLVKLAACTSLVAACLMETTASDAMSHETSLSYGPSHDLRVCPV